jgi:hypothetical protein
MEKTPPMSWQQVITEATADQKSTVLVEEAFKELQNLLIESGFKAPDTLTEAIWSTMPATENTGVNGSVILTGTPPPWYTGVAGTSAPVSGQTVLYPQGQYLPTPFLNPTDFLAQIRNLVQLVQNLHLITQSWANKFEALEAERNLLLVDLKLKREVKEELELEVSKLKKQVAELQDKLVPGRFEGMELE